MKQIYQWTGIKLDCVVNFLKMPENEDDIHERRGVSITHADSKTREQMRSSTEHMEATSPFLNDSSSSTSEGLDWCVPSLDIEAKVENGWLGMGVFVPRDILDEEAVGRFVEDLRWGLEGLVC